MEGETIDWKSFELKVKAINDVHVKMIFWFRNFPISSDLIVQFFVGCEYFDKKDGRRIVIKVSYGCTGGLGGKISD